MRFGTPSTGPLVFAVRKVQTGRSGRSLQSGDINLRQVLAADEIRLQYSARHTSAASNPEDILVRKDRHEITWPAVLLQIIGGGLQDSGEFLRITDAIEFAEARGTL